MTEWRAYDAEDCNGEEDWNAYRPTTVKRYQELGAIAELSDEGHIRFIFPDTLVERDVLRDLFLSRAEAFDMHNALVHPAVDVWLWAQTGTIYTLPLLESLVQLVYGIGFIFAWFEDTARGRAIVIVPD